MHCSFFSASNTLPFGWAGCVQSVASFIAPLLWRGAGHQPLCFGFLLGVAFPNSFNFINNYCNSVTSSKHLHHLNLQLFINSKRSIFSSSATFSFLFYCLSLNCFVQSLISSTTRYHTFWYLGASPSLLPLFFWQNSLMVSSVEANMECKWVLSHDREDCLEIVKAFWSSCFEILSHARAGDS